jgi:hypothetical protein
MNNGGPAFPFETERVYNDGGSIDTIDYSNPGMSLRDWFAGMALIGFCGCIELHLLESEFAYKAYAQADAMIKEREK